MYVRGKDFDEISSLLFTLVKILLLIGKLKNNSAIPRRQSPANLTIKLLGTSRTMISLKDIKVIEGLLA